MKISSKLRSSWSDSLPRPFSEEIVRKIPVDYRECCCICYCLSSHPYLHCRGMTSLLCCRRTTVRRHLIDLSGLLASLLFLPVVSSARSVMSARLWWKAYELYLVPCLHTTLGNSSEWAAPHSHEPNWRLTIICVHKKNACYVDTAVDFSCHIVAFSMTVSWLHSGCSVAVGHRSSQRWMHV